MPSPAQKLDLANQRGAIERSSIASGRAVGEREEDIGSGLNYKRKGFLGLMEAVERGEVSEVVIARKDRLLRFGFEFSKRFWQGHGCEVAVMNAELLSPEEEMVQDLPPVVHCFSSRLYGLRLYKEADVTAIARG